MNDICNHEVNIININKFIPNMNYPGFYDFTYTLECKICKSKDKTTVTSSETDYIYLYHDNTKPLKTWAHINTMYEYVLDGAQHNFEITNTRIKCYLITKQKITNLKFLECKNCNINFVHHHHNRYYSNRNYNTLNCNDRIVEGILD